jgi:dTDP-4-amino-4,6-dideoxygalactose transaminase
MAIVNKISVDELAVFGGESIFSIPKSTSNLLKPDIEKFLNYSKNFHSARHYTNNGPNVRLLEQRLAAFHGSSFCVTFSSGFWALASIRALAIKGRSEVIVPSLTYRRMADILSWVDLKPIFCEVDPASLAITRATAEACITEETALILAPHPIVNCCPVEDLVGLASSKNIPIIFDSVESVFESVASGKIGSFGNAECFSLHACKLFNGFGGGYLTTNDKNLAEELSATRSFGFIDVDTVGYSGGLNSKLNEMHAAMALASFDDVHAQVIRNSKRYFLYKELLTDFKHVRLLEFDERYDTGYKNIVVEILDSSPLSRNEIVRIFNAENILARPYYDPPLHHRSSGYLSGEYSLGVTDKLAASYINLPCGHLVEQEDILNIVQLFKFIMSVACDIAPRLSLEGSES